MLAFSIEGAALLQMPVLPSAVERALPPQSIARELPRCAEPAQVRGRALSGHVEEGVGVTARPLWLRIAPGTRGENQDWGG